MNRIKLIFALLLLLILITVGALFAMLNTDEVVLNLFFVETPALPLSWLIFAAFGIGLILGGLLASISVLRVKVAARRDQKRLQRSPVQSPS